MTATSDALDVEVPEPLLITVEEAKQLLTRVKTALADLVPDIIRLYTTRAWEVLGYPTWQVMCQAELPVVSTLDIEQRRVVAVALREQGGLSVRAIAPLLGVDPATVSRDLTRVANATPGEVNLAAYSGNGTRPPTSIVGLDGKNYASHPRGSVREGTSPAHGFAAAATKVDRFAQKLLDFCNRTEFESEREALAVETRDELSDAAAKLGTVMAVLEGAPTPASQALMELATRPGEDSPPAGSPGRPR